MKLLTFSFLLFSVCLFANNSGNYPLIKYRLDSVTHVISQDQEGNIISGGSYGLRILKEGKWVKYGTWKQNISHIEADHVNQLLVADSTFFGQIVMDSLLKYKPQVYSNLDFEQVQNIINTSSGNYIHVDNRILRLGEEMVDYNYTDVLFAGKLNKNLVIQRQKMGLFLFAGNNFRKINGSEAYADEKIISIIEINSGRFLLVFQDQSVIYDGDNFVPWTREGEEWIKRLDVQFVAGNEEGIFISSSADLYQLSKDGELLRVMNMGDPIHHLFSDDDGNLWLGGDREIIHLQTSSPIQLVTSLNESGTSLIKSDDELYIGTKRGAYKSDLISFMNGGLPLKINNEYTNNFFLNAGQCLISDHNGLDVYDGRLRNLSSSGESFSVMILDEGSTMIEATKSGLNLYENKYNRWSFLNHLYGIEEEINQILQDEQGRVWAYSKTRGIYKLNYDSILRAINPQLFTIEDVSADEVNGLFLINGKPIITSSQGVFEFNESIGRFEGSGNYNDAFGPENDIETIYQDERENIWYISKEESGVLIVVDKGVEKTTKKVTLPFLQAHLNLDDPFIYSLGNGEMVFGGEKGFVFLNQNELQMIG